MNSDIRFYWKVLVRRLPIMTVIFIICAAVGVGLAVTLPPRYEASARLLVEGAQIPDELASSTVQTEAAQRLEIIRQQLLTRENLIDVANELRVFGRNARMSPDEVVEAMRELVTIRTLGGRNRATFMTIGFSAEQPAIASSVVNEFVTIVLQQDAERRQVVAEQTLDFFQEEVRRLSEELELKSQAIVEFKDLNQDALPENLNYRVDRQSQLQDQIIAATRDRASLEEQRNRLTALGSIQANSPNSLPPEQQALQAAQLELQQALTIFSENNPRIKLLRARVQQLEASANVAPEATDEPAASDDPARKLYELQLTEIDQRIKILDSQIQRSQTEIAVLSDAIERTPENAIQLDALEREYRIVEGQYNGAVSNLAKAQTGERIELLSRGERITVIEQATPPTEPSSPNRRLIAGGGVVLGSGLAAALFILLEMFNRTIRRPSDLVRGLSIQPIATIPYLETAGGKFRRRVLQVLLVLAIAVGIPAGLWAIHTFYMPLDLLIAKLMDRFGF